LAYLCPAYEDVEEVPGPHEPKARSRTTFTGPFSVAPWISHPSPPTATARSVLGRHQDVVRLREVMAGERQELGPWRLLEPATSVHGVKFPKFKIKYDTGTIAHRRPSAAWPLSGFLSAMTH
jgi:hypothetical protein